MYGANNIVLPSQFINTLKFWNTNAGKSGAEYDKRIVIALLLILVKPQDLADHKVNDDVKNFIYGMQFDIQKRLLYQ